MTVVIDLFAGPGGLAEGFSSVRRTNGESHFKIGLSVEKEAHAFNTLKLRAFFRALPPKSTHDYYSYLKGDLSKKELFEKHPDALIKAERETLYAELGCSNSCTVDALNLRISKALEGETHWVLIGGPPCQAYSIVGRARNKGNKEYIAEKDPRHFLYKEYLRILGVHEPAIFVMENVRGILSSQINGEKIFPRILKDLARPGETLKNNGESVYGNAKYNLYPLTHESPVLRHNTKITDPYHFLVHADRHGVPQARQRVFVVGVREDLDIGSIPLLKEVDRKTTVKDVLADLPPLGSQLSRGLGKYPFSCGNQLYDSLERNWFSEISSLDLEPAKITQIKQRIIEAVSSRLQEEFPNTGGEYILHQTNCNALGGWYNDAHMEFVCNSTTRCHMLEDLYRYIFAACYAEATGVSPKLSDYPESLLPNHANAKTGHFDDRFRVQIADHPSTTITSHISKDGHFFIHYDPMQCRSLTVREAARLQTFPDNYFFEGPRTAQFTQVGNAVPPYLAYQIAKSIRELLIKIES